MALEKSKGYTKAAVALANKLAANSNGSRHAHLIMARSSKTPLTGRRYVCSPLLSFSTSTQRAMITNGY